MMETLRLHQASELCCNSHALNDIKLGCMRNVDKFSQDSHNTTTLQGTALCFTDKKVKALPGQKVENTIAILSKYFKRR